MTSWLEGFTATGSMRGDPTPLRDDRAKLLESPPVNAARRPTPWPAMGPMSSADQKVGRVSQIASSWRTERRAPTLLDDAAVMHGDGGINQVASERPQPRQNPVLVGSGEPRIADDTGHQDRGQFSGLAYGATPPRPCQPFRVRARPLGGIAKTR